MEQVIWCQHQHGPTSLITLVNITFSSTIRVSLYPPWKHGQLSTMNLPAWCRRGWRGRRGRTSEKSPPWRSLSLFRVRWGNFVKERAARRIRDEMRVQCMQRGRGSIWVNDWQISGGRSLQMFLLGNPSHPKRGYGANALRNENRT